jgi:hypothetical protein
MFVPCLTAVSQTNGVVIGAANAPDPSAILDLVSIDKGFLVPRMTGQDRALIANPAEGLLIYLNDDGCFYYYHGGSWLKLTNSLNASDVWIDQKWNILSRNSANQSLPGTNSVIIGRDAFNDNANSSSFMNIIGFEAAKNDQTIGYGFVNAMGYQAAYSNSGANLNAMGQRAAYSNTGSFVNAFGYECAKNNTGGHVNAIGTSALRNPTATVTLTNAIGYEAAESSGYLSNVNVIGTHAAYHCTGNIINAIGLEAGDYNTASYLNAIGGYTANHNTGEYVNAIGLNAGSYNTGYNVNLFGHNTGYNNKNSDVNAMGQDAAMNNTGAQLVAIGGSAAKNNTGDYNNAIGWSALTNPATGTNMVNAIGYEAAYNCSYSANLNAIGTHAAAHSQGTNINAIGLESCDYNAATWVNAIGSYSANHNTAEYVNAFGVSAASYNTGLHVNAWGINSAYSNHGQFVNAIGANSAYNNTKSYVNVIGSYSPDAPQNEVTILTGDLYLKDPTGSGGSTTGNKITFDNGNYIESTAPATVQINQVLRLTPSAEPTSPVEGMIYYDSSLKKLRVYTGSAWESL